MGFTVFMNKLHQMVKYNISSIICVFPCQLGIQSKYVKSNQKNGKTSMENFSQIHTNLHSPRFTCFLSESCQYKNVKQTDTEVGLGLKKIRIEVIWSWVVLLKPVKPQLFPLFAIANSRIVFPSRERPYYLRLKQSQITRCLILFRYSA